MRKPIFLWVIAFLITVIVAVFQRVTGPTYPITDSADFLNFSLEYKLFRSHGGDTDHIVKVKVPDSSMSGTLYYKRFKTDDDWTKIEMKYQNDSMYAALPWQPPAGKLEYFLKIRYGDEIIQIPKNSNVVIRHKGSVPLFVLILHVIAIFGAMLLSTRTGLEYFSKERKNISKLTLWTLGFLLVGGFFLGPLVQLYAFDAWWTGFPFGTDLTDNKTLIAMIGWLIAWSQLKRSKFPERWALSAALVLLLIFLIPHSMMGSEIDYNKLDEQNKIIEQVEVD